MDKIICVGKNYLEHAKELGDAVPEKPVLFLKPPSVLKLAKGGEITQAELPTESGQVHHECEIVLRLKAGGFKMNLAEAESAIGWVSVGLDMTLRDKQALLKKAGAPWTVSKVFPDSAVVGPWISKTDFSNYALTEFSITVNGAVRQVGTASQMTLSPAACVAYISEHFPLCTDDLIYTGTPKGVNAIGVGDTAVLKFGPIQYTVHWNALR